MTRGRVDPYGTSRNGSSGSRVAAGPSGMTLTIMALAVRSSDYVLQEMKAGSL